MTSEEITLNDPQIREVRAAEQAITTAEAERAKLMPNGRPLYAPDEHAKREQAIEAALDAALARVSEAADAAVRESAAALERLTDTDPLGTLTSVEQEAANRRATFVREDAERLPLADLTRRVRQALAGSDQSMLYLWLRYGDQRLQTEHANGNGGAPELRALADAVREAGNRFVDTSAVASAERRLSQARAFRRQVSEATRPLLVGRTIAEMRASGRYAAL